MNADQPQTPIILMTPRILTRELQNEAMDTDERRQTVESGVAAVAAPRKTVRCSYCKMTGHNRRYCSQREYDEENTPAGILVEVKRIDRQILRQCLNSSHILDVLRNVSVYLWSHLWKWNFPHSRNLPTDLNGSVCYIQIRNNIVDEYMYLIQDHPQYEERFIEFRAKQSTLKKLQQNYERYNTAVNERIREHQREIIALQNDLHDYLHEYNIDCATLRIVPRFKEFIITHMKEIPKRVTAKTTIENVVRAIEEEDGQVAEMDTSEVATRDVENDCNRCPICFNDFDMEKMVFVQCSGYHYTCYDCMIMLTQSQEIPSCPLCREKITSMGCCDYKNCLKLVDRFMI
jgi:hypothetical protein